MADNLSRRERDRELGMNSLTEISETFAPRVDWRKPDYR